MLYLLGILFLAGYILITVESITKVDKSAIAVTLSMLLWFILMLYADKFPLISDSVWFKEYCSLTENSYKAESDCKFDFIKDIVLMKNLGDVSEIFFFLFSAMSIVEMIDINGGFTIITDRINSGNKLKLLWVLTFLAFFLSSIIDNMTTSIVMVSLINKLLTNRNDMLFFSSMIIIAANSGGVWSPMGDVTSILLWSDGAISAVKIISFVILPGLISVMVPLLIISFKIRHKLKSDNSEEICNVSQNYILPQRKNIPAKPEELPINPAILANSEKITPVKDRRRRIVFLILGVFSIVMIPLLREMTEIPPFADALFILGILWILTDLVYIKNPATFRFSDIIPRLDVATLFFFLGILLSVAALQVSGVMNGLAEFLKERLSDIYVINIIIGFVSSIIDNVPLVAAALDLYPIENPAIMHAANMVVDPNLVPDGKFWLLLNYCAGVGGSIFIIGSAAGVVVMGIQKINFIWYLKNITLYSVLGYLAGFFFLVLEMHIFYK